MKHYDEKQMQENILYLEALSEQYPNIQSAAATMSVSRLLTSCLLKWTVSVLTRV